MWWGDKINYFDVIDIEDIPNPIFLTGNKGESFIFASLWESDDQKSEALALSSLICKYDEGQTDMYVQNLSFDMEPANAILKEAIKNGYKITDKTKIFMRIFHKFPNGETRQAVWKENAVKVTLLKKGDISDNN